MRSNGSTSSAGIHTLLHIIETLAIVGTLAVAAISLYHSMTQPNADDIIRRIAEESSRNIEQVQQLIHAEAAATRAGDIEKAASLYAPDAVVRDGTAGDSWHGLQEIRDRYSKLPRFTELDHVDVDVSVKPGGDSASAVASTSGEMLNADGSSTPIWSILGEYWTFEKVEGAWRIASFTYDAR